jgi:hypothetical protein
MHAFLILGAILVLRALGNGTTPHHAESSGWALDVGRAGLAAVGVADRALWTLRDIPAVAGDRVAATSVALATLAAVTSVAALLTLATHTEFLVLAILVGIAGRVVGLAPSRRHKQESPETSEHQSILCFLHGLPSAAF